MVDGQRTKLIRCTCHFCGVSFFASRADAKFDTPVCRTRAYRWRQKLPDQAREIDRVLEMIWQYLDYPASRDQAIEILTGISRVIDGNLVERGIKVQRVR